ncbi:MAG: 4Fe-4S dicluster domain-containing protein [Candidatus Thorarchaeota archaeon]
MVRTRLTPSASFIQELTSMPGGELIEKCVACGVCTASCAVASGSQYNPRQVMQKILVGARERVLESEQPWLCKTCHLCEDSCQYGVKLADVFKVVRKLAIREGIVPIAFQQAAQTILTDGWLMKEAYSDFVADERKGLGLSSRLSQNKQYTRDVKSKYFDTGG